MAKRPVSTVTAPDKRWETLPVLLKPSTAPAAPEPAPIEPAAPCPETLSVPAAEQPGNTGTADNTLNLSVENATTCSETCSEPARSRKTIDWKQTPYAVILGARVLQAVATEAEVLKFIETLTEKQQQKVVVGQVRKLSLTIKF